MASPTPQQSETEERLSLGGQLAGKYMTFKLASENYGLEILRVREIIGLLYITRIPRTPEFVQGVINLRGRVIPVIDLRQMFGMPKTDPTDQTVIIVVQYECAGRSITAGILVDEVVEVLDVKADRIEPTPSFGTSDINTEFIRGIGKADTRILFLLDIARVLTSSKADEVLTTPQEESPQEVASAE